MISLVLLPACLFENAGLHLVSIFIDKTVPNNKTSHEINKAAGQYLQRALPCDPYSRSYYFWKQSKMVSRPGGEEPLEKAPL